MRNKIKQLLKKEGGFTLIELLAVIAILALIIAISIPLIGNVVSKSETTTKEAQKELVIDAARLYFIQEKNPVSATTVTTKQLEDNGYLETKSGEKPNPAFTVTKTENKFTITGGTD